MSLQIPVTVVGGRWGSGKSAVVDRLLPALPDGAALLCDGRSDHHHDGAGPGPRVVHVEAEVLQGTKGCDCCAVRTDLSEALDDLLDRRVRPTHVVIEAVGGSDLAVIAQTFLRTPRLRHSMRIAGLVTVLDGHAAGTALPAHPTGGLDGLELDAVAMADLVVVNRLDRLVPVTEQRTAWTLWSMCGSGRVHIDDARHDTDPLPARILGLPGFDLHRQAAELSGRCRDQVISASSEEHPLRRVSLVMDGLLDQGGLERWIDEVQDRSADHLLRWRGRFAVAGHRRRWLAHGIRTSVELDDGEPLGNSSTSAIELIGRLPPSTELQEGLLAARCP